jgi:putrescine transport system substrate-binding protein
VGQYRHRLQHRQDQGGAGRKRASGFLGPDLQAPKEGAAIWFDMVAMPVDAPDEKAGYAFMNYLLRPDVMASISNHVHYANGNAQADSLIDPAIKNDTKVYPSPDMMGKLFALEAMPLNIDRIRTRVWNKIRTGS